MPKCVDCGKETPRDDMRGAPDDLRCLACVQKRYPVYDPPPRPREMGNYPPVTSAMVVAAIVCTILNSSNPEIASRLIAVPHLVWAGEVWRLVTSAFVHANIIHLVFDIWFIWVFGRPVEAWMGSFLYAGFVILTAAGPIGAEILVSVAPAVGLSGVGFALFGLHFALRLYKDFAAATMQPQTVQSVVVFFFLCIVLTYAGVMRIANVTHLTGAILGWLFGKASLSRWRVWEIAGVCVLAVVMAGSCLYMPWNREFATFRCDECLRKGDARGAEYWFNKANKALGIEMRLDLPENK
jgi:membrane associated rhomboid family serine protease